MPLSWGKSGEPVLAAPVAEGFNLLAWVLPFVTLALGVAVVIVIRSLTPVREPVQKPETPETEEISAASCASWNGCGSRNVV